MSVPLPAPSRVALVGTKRNSASPTSAKTARRARNKNLRPPPSPLSAAVAVRARRSLFDDGGGFDAFDSLFDSLERGIERAESLSDFASSRSRSTLAPRTRRRGGETREGAEEKEIQLPGGKGFARTRSSSGRTASSSWSSYESTVVWGVDPRVSVASTRPAAAAPSSSPLAALATAALLAYAAVAAKFARATSEGETRYSKKSRWRLALLWPLLAVASPGFREELGGAVLPKKRKRKNEKGGSEKTSPSPSPPSSSVVVEADDVISPR